MTQSPIERSLVLVRGEKCPFYVRKSGKTKEIAAYEFFFREQHIKYSKKSLSFIFRLYTLKVSVHKFLTLFSLHLLH